MYSVWIFPSFLWMITWPSFAFFASSFALAMAFVLSGAVLVEVVFSYPGIGYMLFKAVQGVDYPLIQGIVMTIILALALATLILDLTLPLLDPRIRRE